MVTIVAPPDPELLWPAGPEAGPEEEPPDEPCEEPLCPEEPELL